MAHLSRAQHVGGSEMITDIVVIALFSAGVCALWVEQFLLHRRFAELEHLLVAALIDMRTVTIRLLQESADAKTE